VALWLCVRSRPRRGVPPHRVPTASRQAAKCAKQRELKGCQPKETKKGETVRSDAVRRYLRWEYRLQAAPGSSTVRSPAFPRVEQSDRPGRFGLPEMESAPPKDYQTRLKAVLQTVPRRSAATASRFTSPAAHSLPLALSRLLLYTILSATPRTNDKRVGEPRQVVRMWRDHNE
jgi:hypothetical protein